MIACLHPSNQFFEENNMTLTYAAKAAMIKNKPVKNDDPKTRLIQQLKGQVKSLTLELVRANQYIANMSAVTGEIPKKFGAGLIPGTVASGSIE